MISIAFPSIDPVAISLGPLAVRWYGLAYMAGILLAWRSAIWLLPRFSPITRKQVDDFVTWALWGVVLGGRLGHVLLYAPGEYLRHPLKILFLWEGGMAFHGGLIGVAVAFRLYCQRHHIPIRRFADLCCCGIPAGLFFGRIANFINQEVWGRVSDVPWAVVFPRAGALPRHPSQLYEAVLEGLVLGILLLIMARKTQATQKPGVLAGTFLIGYGTMRIGVEFFREPEFFLGALDPWITWGQLLSLPFIIWGMWLCFTAPQRKT